MYQGKHRTVRPRHRITTGVATVLAVTASALVAPLALSGPAGARADTLSVEGLPRFLQRATTLVNPPTPAPGEAVAPPVPQSYVITGDALSRYDVTTTALAQQEIAAFVARVKTEHDIALDASEYRVYAMPPITATRDPEAIGNLAELVQAIEAAAADTATVPSAVLQDGFAPVLALGTATPETVTQLVQDASAYLDMVVPDAQRALSMALALIIDLLNRPLPDPSPTVEQIKQTIRDNGIKVGGTDPMAEVDNVQSLIESFDALATLQDLLGEADPVTQVETIKTAVIDLVTPFTDPGPLIALLAQIVDSAGLPTPDEIAEDPAHTSPVGTDLVTDTYGGVLGDVLVLPVGVGVTTVGAAVEDGVYKASTLLETTPAAAAVPVVAGLLEAQPDHEESWDPAGGIGCTGRKSNFTAWYDTCTFWYSLAKDGNANRQTWGLKQYGTGKSKRAYTLNSLELRSWRMKDSPDQDWLDWSPRADADHGGCSSQTVGVNVKAVYLEHTGTLCEKWDIDKGEEPAAFANTWRGNVRRSERDVASVIATNTPNGFRPQDYVRFDYHA